MSLKQWVPWWAKIAVKVVLSRMRIDHRRWQRLGLFVHGGMNRPKYALQVVMSHLARVGWTTLDGKTVLELGPGDSLATAVISRALGSQQVYLVDVGDFAAFERTAYVELQRYLESQGLHPPDVGRCATRDEILRLCRAEYLTDGLSGLKRVPTGSVDLVFSQAVLEHVRLTEFDGTQREVRRVLKPQGLASHQVDLRDHLGGALNNLRFAQTTWEAEWMVASGFYTNRLRHAEVLASMRQAGLATDTTAIERWSTLPTPRARLDQHFRTMADDELRVQQFDCVARVDPAGPTT